MSEKRFCLQCEYELKKGEEKFCRTRGLYCEVMFEFENGKDDWRIRLSHLIDTAIPRSAAL